MILQEVKGASIAQRVADSEAVQFARTIFEVAWSLPKQDMDVAFVALVADIISEAEKTR